MASKTKPGTLLYTWSKRARQIVYDAPKPPAHDSDAEAIEPELSALLAKLSARGYDLTTFKLLARKP